VNLIHQIWHGDSRELVTRFKPGRIQSCICDPPFGVDNLSKMAVTADGKDYARKIAGDESPEQAITLFQEVVTALIPAMKPESDFYVFTAGQVLKEWLFMTQEFFPKFGYEPKGILVWAKGSPGLGDLESWGQALEYILYFKRGNRQATQTRQNGFFTDQQIAPGKLIHPHEKPTSLLVKLIEHSTNRGDLVVDIFGGSGSLVRAAQRVGRSAVAMEIDEKNYKLAQEALTNSEGAGLFD
jgi:adenine-specific DNA-methyltransferase